MKLQMLLWASRLLNTYPQLEISYFLIDTTRGLNRILTCPNYLGLIFYVWERTLSLDLEHINMFNPKSLALLVEI